MRAVAMTAGASIAALPNALRERDELARLFEGRRAAVFLGFDIWSPREGTLQHEAGGGFEELIERVTERVREEADPIEGSLVEPKKASVALHYRVADDPEIGGRGTSAAFVLDSIEEVERFLDTPAR